MDKEENMFLISCLPINFSTKINFTDSCWLWRGATEKKSGYGKFQVKRKRISSHRFSWIHFKGDIPEGLFVLHKCDIRNCVNPAHLFLGTNRENLDDMINKGRSLAGERNKNAKLTQNDVDEIRKTYRRGTNVKSEFSMSSLAEKYNVSVGQISAIINNKWWKVKAS